VLKQSAIFDFFCHLAIKQCESAHNVLCLGIFRAACLFLDMFSAFQKALPSKTEIHSAPFNFSHTNALAEHGFRNTSNFHVDKKEPRPAQDVAEVFRAKETITITIVIHFTTTSHPRAIAHCAVIHTIKGGSVCTLAFPVDVFFLHTQTF
jgi:hypothetical protein